MNSNDGNGPKGNNNTGGSTYGGSGKAASDGYGGISGGSGKAEGGLIKKMRNDNTAGLASKKKAKQKAQAKKGALAAKRT